MRPIERQDPRPRPGATEFVELARTDGIPLGSEVDAKNGRVRLTTEPGDGKPLQRARLLRRHLQDHAGRRHVDLTLSEELAACKKKKASAAAEQGRRSRKLWGDGKGKFRTRGRYSAATVRGTELARAGLLRRHADAGHARASSRCATAKKTVLVRAGQQLPGQAARASLTVWRLPGTPESG